MSEREPLRPLEQLEAFRRSIAPPDAAGSAGGGQKRERDVGWALTRLREAAEAARQTEQRNQELQERKDALASRVEEELDLASARIRSAEARAQAAEIRAAHAEARIAELQQWLDRIHDLILEEFPLGLAVDGQPESKTPVIQIATHRQS
ncbi:MAG TPA: hypothetical protein VF601_18295 [Beijerinckiaceae bacterium]|jgi:seryl-tRNA synthetase